MSGDDPHDRFVCPDCHGEVRLDPEIRQALVSHGCVLCGSTVSPDAFTA